MRIQNAFVLVLVSIFTATVLPGQELDLPKETTIAEISGAPGAFTYATGLVLKPGSDLAYVTNPGSGIVQEFRQTSGEITRSLELPSGLGSAALTADGRTLAVLGITTQKIYLIDTSTFKVRREGSYAPSGFTARCNLLINTSSTKIFVADPVRNQVAVLNVLDGAVDRFIKVGPNPNHLAPVPDSSRFVVLCNGFDPGDEEDIYVIDGISLAVVDYRPLEGFSTEPFNNLQFTGNGTQVLVSSYGDDRVGRFDLGYPWKLRIVQARGKGPSRAATSPNGRLLAVVNAGSDTISVYTLPELFEDHQISVPGLDLNENTLPVFSKDSHTLYIPSITRGQILAYDVEGRRVRRVFTAGAGPTALKLNAEGNIIASLDVTGNVLSLIATHPSSTYIPHLVQTPSDYSGVAAANFGERPISVALYARGEDGSLLPGRSNPRFLSVGPGQQVSLVAWQVFGFDTAARISGYIEAYTLDEEVASLLYLSGDTGQTRLDGFIPDSRVGKWIGFSRLTEAAVEFGSTTWTEITLLNPNDAEAQVELVLYGPSPAGPASLLSYQTRRLPAHALLRQTLSQLAPTVSYPVHHGYLQVNSTEPLAGLATVKIGDSIAMIPAGIRYQPETSFVATQFASGGAGVLDTPIFSNVSLCNTSAEIMSVTLQVTGSDGNPVPAKAKPVVVTLLPNETVVGGADTVLKFPSPSADPALYKGTLQIVADRPGLLADLLYGDAAGGRYLTPASLHDRPGRTFAFGHFAEGRFGDPAKGLYTGLAFYNPNISQSFVVVEAFAPDGRSLGKAEFMLDKTSRTDRTLPQIIPELAQQNGGTIKVTSILPILLYGVFGSGSSDFLVAVHPVPLVQ